MSARVLWCSAWVTLIAGPVLSVALLSPWPLLLCLVAAFAGPASGRDPFEAGWRK